MNKINYIAPPFDKLLTVNQLKNNEQSFYSSELIIPLLGDQQDAALDNYCNLIKENPVPQVPTDAPCSTMTEFFNIWSDYKDTSGLSAFYNQSITPNDCTHLDKYVPPGTPCTVSNLLDNHQAYAWSEEDLKRMSMYYPIFTSRAEDAYEDFLNVTSS